VALDRQAIERRDFPIGRRGYDPAAVDAHLRTLAVEFEELQRAAINGGVDASVAATAGTQVQGIIQAAETAAAEIERHALETAGQVREAADHDAERTREQALEKARAHVAAVAQVTAGLLERVGSMDGEVRALIDSLRAGAGRLAGDLSAVETNMAELYDAAGAHAGSEEPPPPAASPFETELADALGDAPGEVPPPIEPALRDAPAAEPQEGGGDLDGARLVALNMALNGESRADTERYLAENFQIADRLKLIDEVYAAVEA
jgi:hypothetical protein